jgi:hypothetical protein
MEEIEEKTKDEAAGSFAKSQFSKKVATEERE